MRLRSRKGLDLGDVALDLSGMLPREWITRGVQLVKNRCCGKEVRSALQWPVFHLLRRPVVGILNLLRGAWCNDIAIMHHTEIHQLERSAGEYFQVRRIQRLVQHSLFK